jgi:hypothetical protein
LKPKSTSAKKDEIVKKIFHMPTTLEDILWRIKGINNKEENSLKKVAV